MGLREDAINEILACQLDLQQAKANLEPIEQVTGVVNAPLAYQNITDSITLCGQAVTVLQDAPGNPVIDVAPGSFSFTFPGAVQTMGVRNAGTGTLQGTISTRLTGGGSPPNWLTVQPTTFSSTGLPDESQHTVTVNWSLIPAGALVTAEIVLDSNGGQAIRALTAQNGTAQGGPALDVIPASINIVYPEDGPLITIFNSGNQAQALAWSAAQQQPYSWFEVLPPTSGTATTEQDTVQLNVFWGGSFPPDQTQTRNGNVVITGTFDGNPVPGSPKVVSFTATRNASAPPPPPPPPPSPPPSGGQCPGSTNFPAQGGVPFWADWCCDETNNFQSVSSTEGNMNHNGQALRTEPGPTWPRIGVPMPTVGSRRVIMECDLNFPLNWLQGLLLGGQHFGGPGWDQPDNTGDGIRVDYAAPAHPGGPGYSYLRGFDGQIYVHRNGVNGLSSATKFFCAASSDVFQPGVWKHVKFDTIHNPTAGTVTVSVTYGSGPTVTDTVTSTQFFAGNPARIGDGFFWGNTDGRTGRVGVRNMSYRTS